MDREIGDRQSTAKDYEKFNRRIYNQVDILKKILPVPISVGVKPVLVLNSNCT